MMTYEIKKCERCGNVLSSKTILKSFWNGYKNFNCLNCQSVYEFNSKDRLIGGIVVGISIFITNLIMFTIEFEFIWKLIVGFFVLIFLAVIFSKLSLPFLTFNKENT